MNEIRAALSELGIELWSLNDIADLGEAEETGTTFEENAVLKARFYHQRTGMAVLADDSGLEVDPLSGFPGLHSARFLGCSASDAERCRNLVAMLRQTGLPQEQWRARFVCVLALALPGCPVETFRGEWRGLIVAEPRGEHGFGYDPIFLDPRLERTAAELTCEEKNARSHRGAALRQLAARLARLPRS